ncbi:MAG: hypothetical protein OXH31_00325 [Gammaproteobacteria bacterium]|nr:hypothetical protein [Gammaproteobacteria bacterium]
MCKIEPFRGTDGARLSFAHPPLDSKPIQEFGVVLFMTELFGYLALVDREC